MWGSVTFDEGPSLSSVTGFSLSTFDAVTQICMTEYHALIMQQNL